MLLFARSITFDVRIDMTISLKITTRTSSGTGRLYSPLRRRGDDFSDWSGDVTLSQLRKFVEDIDEPNGNWRVDSVGYKFYPDDFDRIIITRTNRLTVTDDVIELTFDQADEEGVRAVLGDLVILKVS